MVEISLVLMYYSIDSTGDLDVLGSVHESELLMDKIMPITKAGENTRISFPKESNELKFGLDAYSEPTTQEKEQQIDKILKDLLSPEKHEVNIRKYPDLEQINLDDLFK